jgi:hypothetical protein
MRTVPSNRSQPPPSITLLRHHSLTISSFARRCINSAFANILNYIIIIIIIILLQLKLAFHYVCTCSKKFNEPVLTVKLGMEVLQINKKTPEDKKIIS